MEDTGKDIALTYRSLHQRALPYHEIIRRKEYDRAIRRWPLLNVIAEIKVTHPVEQEPEA